MELIEWLSCKESLINLGFTETEIKQALIDAEIKENDLTDVKGFKHEPHYLKKYELVKSGVYFTQKEYNGCWERDVEVYGSEYRIIGHYQGLKHGKIIFQLFKNKYNWFDIFKHEVIEKSKPRINSWTKLKDIPESFHNISVKELIEMSEPVNITVSKSSWDIYELHSDKNPEMYLKTEFGSLYVPYKAILTNDFSLITNRMKSYALDYHDPIKLSGFALNHRGRTKQEYKKDKEQDYLNMIKPLESEEALQLQKYLS